MTKEFDEYMRLKKNIMDALRSARMHQFPRCELKALVDCICNLYPLEKYKK